MTTLTVLKSSVDAWLARDDIAVSGTNFNEILITAEARIARRIRTVVQETTATINFTSNTAALPADLLEIRNVYINTTGRKIEYRTPQVLREIHPRRPLAQFIADGGFYTLEGDMTSSQLQMILSGEPTASSPTDVDILYFARFPALVVGVSETNWLLANHFDIYLYATLRVSAEFLQDDELEVRYDARFNAAIEELNRSENRKRFSAVPKQSYGNPRGAI